MARMFDKISLHQVEFTRCTVDTFVWWLQLARSMSSPNCIRVRVLRELVRRGCRLNGRYRSGVLRDHNLEFWGLLNRARARGGLAQHSKKMFPSGSRHSVPVGSVEPGSCVHAPISTLWGAIAPDAQPSKVSCGSNGTAQAPRGAPARGQCTQRGPAKVSFLIIGTRSMPTHMSTAHESSRFTALLDHTRCCYCG